MDLEQCRSQIWNDPFVSTWDPWQFKSKIPDNLSLPFKKVCFPPHSTHERQSRRSHLHSWTHTVLHLLKIVYVTLFFNFQNCLCDTYFQLQWTPSSWTPSHQVRPDGHTRKEPLVSQQQLTGHQNVWINSQNVCIVLYCNVCSPSLLNLQLSTLGRCWNKLDLVIAQRI